MKSKIETMPQILAARFTGRATMQTERDKRDAERVRADNRARVAAYNRARFVRWEIDLEDMMKGGRAKNCDTLNDYQNDCQDGWGDNDFYFSRDHSPEAEDIAGAAEVIAWSSGYPLRVVAARRDDVERDLRRAMSEAASSDFAYTYFKWLRSSLASAADDAACGGMVWAWLDSNKKATAEDYDSPYIGFSLSRRAFLDRSAPWWDSWKPGDVWNNYDNNRERLEAAGDIVGEYLSEKMRGCVNVEHFNERGGEYGDPADWPERLADYSETAESLHAENEKMRAMLKAQIKARAPLAVRAATVASVYGTPGEVISEDGDE